MVIALLALLGVDLVVLVALAVLVIGRKRWVRRHPGAFAGAVRAADGADGGGDFGPKWRRGYGRWVRDVLVWTRAPFFFRNEVVPVDGSDGPRPARPDEVGRLGPSPVVVTFAAGTSRIEVAVRSADRERALGPFREDRVDPSAVPTPRASGAVPTSPDT